MNNSIYNKLNNAFDFVGVINKNKYPNYENEPMLEGIESIFVFGLAYPNVFLKQQKDAFNASMYTYGYDYHDVMRSIVDVSLEGEEYITLVDNHPLNEQKCLELTGLAYHAKNNLMIHKKYGSYFFIGLVLTKKKYEEVIVENKDSCGDCTICIKACPVGALSNGFDSYKCLSSANQSKRPLTDLEIKKNSLLLGCDICQRVCPKNKGISSLSVDELREKPTTYVLINDLFDLSNKEFMNKYGKHAYTWRGKTLLLRNALTLLLRNKDQRFNEKIKSTIEDNKYPNWYKEDAKKILNKLNDIN